MEICVLERKSCCGDDLSLERFRALGELREYDGMPDDIAAAVGDAPVVLCNKARFTREVIEKCPNLRYIGLMATGYNVIDVDACRERGIVVANVPGYSTESVAQFTFAFILQFSTSLVTYANALRDGMWIASPSFTTYPFPISELHGKTLAIFGLGTIGRRVAEIGSAFGMEVIYHSRTKKDVPYEYVGRDGLFARADYLTFHCPLTPETTGVLCAENIEKMKPTAFVVNTARGGVAVESDVRAALDSGRIAGYAADVLTCEPQRADCPLNGAKNLFLTPHIAWAPKEARERLIGMMYENLAAFLAGAPTNNVAK